MGGSGRRRGLLVGRGGGHGGAARGGTSAAQGHRDRARRCYEQSLKLDPSCAGVVAALADAMALHPTDHDVVSKGSHAVCCVAATSAANAAEAASQGGAAAVAAAMRDGAADAIAAYPSTERWVAEHGAGRSSRSRSRAGDDVDDESWLVEYERGSVGRTAGRAPRKVEVEEEDGEDGDGDSGSFDFDSNL